MLSHYYDCHSEAVWFQFTNPEDNWNKMYFGAGIIMAERFSEARIQAMIVGPGLPTPIADVPVDIPDQILNDPNMSENVIYLEGPQDQSTCAHLCDIMLVDSLVVDDRCAWHERFTDTTWWWVLDHDEIEIPIGGETYYVVAWEQNFRKVKTVFGMGYWAEDFVTPYPEIAINQERSECPNIDWFDDFSEKTENAERDANLPGDACIPGSPPPNEVIYPGVEDHSHGEDGDHTHEDHDHTHEDGDHTHEDGDHTHEDGEADHSHEDCGDDDAAAVAAAGQWVPGAESCADLQIYCSMSYVSDLCQETCGLCPETTTTPIESQTCEDDDASAVAAAAQWVPGATSCADLSIYCSMSYVSDLCMKTCGMCSDSNDVVQTTIAETEASTCDDDDDAAVAAAAQWVPGATSCADLSMYCSMSYVSDLCMKTCGMCTDSADTTMSETDAPATEEPTDGGDDDCACDMSGYVSMDDFDALRAEVRELQGSLGNVEADNNDVMNAMEEMATCMSGIVDGFSGDDSYDTEEPMTEAPETSRMRTTVMETTTTMETTTKMPTLFPTARMTEKWETMAKLMDEGNNKCSTGADARAFRLTYTSLDNCVDRCYADERCMYASTDEVQWCIGCIQLDRASDGWSAYEMLRGRRQLSEVEQLRRENAALKAELARVRRN